MSILNTLSNFANSIAITLNSKYNKVIGDTIYVNPQTGLDTNPGTSENPVQTINQGFTVAALRPTLYQQKIFLQSGDYSSQTDTIYIPNGRRLQLLGNNQTIYAAITNELSASCYIENLTTTNFIRTYYNSCTHLNNITFNTRNCDRVVYAWAGGYILLINCKFNTSGCNYCISCGAKSMIEISTAITISGSYSTAIFYCDNGYLCLNDNITYSNKASGKQYVIYNYACFRKANYTLSGSAGSNSNSSIW